MILFGDYIRKSIKMSTINKGNIQSKETKKKNQQTNEKLPCYKVHFVHWYNLIYILHKCDCCHSCDNGYKVVWIIPASKTNTYICKEDKTSQHVKRQQFKSMRSLNGAYMFLYSQNIIMILLTLKHIWWWY